MVTGGITTGRVLLARTRTITSSSVGISSLRHTTVSPLSRSNAWMASPAGLPRKASMSKGRTPSGLPVSW